MRQWNPRGKEEQQAGAGEGVDLCEQFLLTRHHVHMYGGTDRALGGGFESAPQPAITINSHDFPVFRQSPLAEVKGAMQKLSSR